MSLKLTPTLFWALLTIMLLVGCTSEADREEARRNLEQANAFLAENAQHADVISTASGLQYQILRPGNGERPTVDDQARVDYEGRLIDGTVFDSSYQRGQSVAFPLKDVISGWKEGIPLMRVGAKWRFFIPPELAYGRRALGDTIGPNSLLIFDVELHAIKKGPPGG